MPIYFYIHNIIIQDSVLAASALAHPTLNSTLDFI